MSIDRTVGVGGVTIGLVGTGIVVLWPEKRWLGWVFIGLGLLIAFVSIAWTLAVWHTRKQLEERHVNSAAVPAPQVTQHAPIHFAPVISPSFNQSQSQTQTQQATAEKPTIPPEVECTDCYFVKGILSSSNRLVNDGGTACMV